MTRSIDQRVRALIQAVRNGDSRWLDSRAHDDCWEAGNGAALLDRVVRAFRSEPGLARAALEAPVRRYLGAPLLAAAAQVAGYEAVRLADGEALQALVPGVAPIPAQSRDIAALERARAARRGSAPPPAGGLFDDVARAQGELF